MKLVGLGLLAAGAALAAAPQTASAAGFDAVQACAGLRALASPTLVIKSAEIVPAGNGFPDHCRLRATLNPRKGAGGRDFGMGFELNLPTLWNRRFLFQGGGGLDGVVNPATGFVTGGPAALTRGYAVVATDAGHQGQDAAFADDDQARKDYAFNALDKVTVEAKAIVQSYYGRRPDHAYFMGCSNGGRQGLIAASRFPTYFDGVVAGDPGFNLAAAAISQVWDTVAFSRVAPKDAGGRPILARAFSPADLKLVSAAVLKACDDKDGLADGMINDIKACRFSPKPLTCAGQKTDSCLTADQVTALEAVFGGPRTSKGVPLYSSWAYDAGVGDPGWRAWKLGDSPTAQSNSLNVILGFDSLRRYFTTPPDPGFDLMKYDFDKDPARTRQTSAINDVKEAALPAFAQRGKLLIYQGGSDPVFSVNDIVRWYEALAKGGDVSGWARLFVVPGMAHCVGGPSTDQFDPLTAMEKWVEEGRAPERMVARGQSFPGVTRPLCPFPKVARYVSGDVKEELSFACR